MSFCLYLLLLYQDKNRGSNFLILFVRVLQSLKCNNLCKVSNTHKKLFLSIAITIITTTPPFTFITHKIKFLFCVIILRSTTFRMSSHHIYGIKTISSHIFTQGHKSQKLCVFYMSTGHLFYFTSLI